MIHTYEVMVDIKEYPEQTSSTSYLGTTRYEVDAETQFKAVGIARSQAISEHPGCTECDIRVTRLLK